MEENTKLAQPVIDSKIPEGPVAENGQTIKLTRNW